MTKEHSKKEESTVESTQATPGQQLMKGREAMGLTQQQVADRLHLRLGNIQDIETDTHKPGVSMTFTKGYVRIYAKLLGMPAEPLLESFDVLHQDENQSAKLQSFSQRVAKQANDDRWMMVTYLIVFLVIASLVIWWYQQSDKSILNRLNLFSENATEQSQGNDISEGEAVSVMTPNEKLPVELAIPEEDIKNQNQQSTNTQSKVNSGQDKASTSLNQAQGDISVNDNVTEEQGDDELSDIDNPFVESDSADNASANLSSQIINGYTVKADGNVDLVFTFKEDCWLSVTDANEEIMAVGVKKKGYVMSVDGTPPISVNMCPPEHVNIDFAGTPVDLSSYPRGFPIKFELSVTGD
ncbi:RodZ domain-containing protein [Glaciecola sp.]|jgi:cytoskeleton protein RodZ|uniref:RodZ domain-containing protein n=1 Tax=Glaciecola sp. MF2-115 TaxID=3384827 RepID=UPI0039895154